MKIANHRRYDIPNKPPTVIGVRGGHRGEGGIHLPHLLFLQCNVIRQWDPTKINAQSVPLSAQLFQNCIAHICFTIVKHCAPLHALVDPGAGIWTCGMCIQEWTNSLHATSISIFKSMLPLVGLITLPPSPSLQHIACSSWHVMPPPQRH